jgi:hypothetical protein
MRLKAQVVSTDESRNAYKISVTKSEDPNREQCLFIKLLMAGYNSNEFYRNILRKDGVESIGSK